MTSRGGRHKWARVRVGGALLVVVQVVVVAQWCRGRQVGGVVGVQRGSSGRGVEELVAIATGVVTIDTGVVTEVIDVVTIVVAGMLRWGGTEVGTEAA